MHSIPRNRHHMALPQSILAGMSMEEKLGQMLMVGFDGPELTKSDQEFMAKYYIGNVILMGRNVPDPQHTKTLTTHLQQIAASRRCPVGFHIAIDQEGGVVTRLTKGATVFPGNMALGATTAAKSEKHTRRAAQVMAREMMALGINMNLAPVLDINNNPDNPGIGVRSYGEDVELVTKLGVTAIGAYRETGVVATAKHCPGKGNVTIDSHIDLPVVPHSMKHLEQTEFVPFIAAIKAGLDAVMTAHVVYPAIEPEYGIPATLSHRVLTGLIRERFGFKGIIVTDDLYMGAIAKVSSSEEAIVQAIEAGADIALLCHHRERQIEAAEALYDAVRCGSISKARVDESVNRILTVKLKYGLIHPPYYLSQKSESALSPSQPVATTGMSALPLLVAQYPLASSPTPAPQDESSDLDRDIVDLVGCAAHRDLALEIARESVTLLRNNDRLIPIRPNQGMNLLVISPDIGSITQVEDEQFLSSPLAVAIQRFAPRLQTLTVSQAPTDDEIRHTIELINTGRANTKSLVILGTYNAHLYRQQANLARAILETGVPCVIVAMRNPYDIKEFPEASTYIAAYGFRDCTMQAVAEIIFGLTEPKGQLPVTIPGLHKFGDGIVSTK